MAQKLPFHYQVDGVVQTGSSLYGRVMKIADAVNIWNPTTNTFAAAVDWADSDKAMTENLGTYLLDLSALASGYYEIIIYKMLGATAAITDTVLWGGSLHVPFCFNDKLP
jgi:hypothetical protein